MDTLMIALLVAMASVLLDLYLIISAINRLGGYMINVINILSRYENAPSIKDNEILKDINDKLFHISRYVEEQRKPR